MYINAVAFMHAISRNKSVILSRQDQMYDSDSIEIDGVT